MNSIVVYDDTKESGSDRVAGLIGENIMETKEYFELAEKLATEVDMWEEVLELNPSKDVLTLNIEEDLEGNAKATVSEYDQTHVKGYVEPVVSLNKLDQENVLEKYARDILGENYVRQTRSLRGIDASCDIMDYLDHTSTGNGLR
jgi:hypothetical protein